MVYFGANSGTISTIISAKINYTYRSDHIYAYLVSMGTSNQSKINKLLNSYPYGTIFTSPWLVKNGYSAELQKRYKSSAWLVSIGKGAMKRTGVEINLDGAIYTLQQQLNLSVHIGGHSALSKQGRAQYLQLNNNEVVLFGKKGEKLPKWFLDNNWGATLKYHTTNFLPPDLGIIELTTGTITSNISNPIRAIFECLYLAPSAISYVECYELLESLSNVHPTLVQNLLESCTSVKVKRMFLYMAEKAGHIWFKPIVMEKVQLGSGKRSLVPNGVYIPKYQITVPKELIENGSDI